MPDSLSSSHDLPLFLSVFASLSCLYVGETERVPLCFSLFSLHLSLCLVVLAFLPCLCGCLCSCFSVLSVSVWVSLSFMLFCLVSIITGVPLSLSLHFCLSVLSVSFSLFLPFCLVCIWVSPSCLFLSSCLISTWVSLSICLSHCHLCFSLCLSVSLSHLSLLLSVSVCLRLCLFSKSLCVSVSVGFSFSVCVSLSIFSCTFGLVHAGDTFSRSGKTGQEKKN